MSKHKIDPVAEMRDLQAGIQRMEAIEIRRNGRLLPGERVDVQRMRRQEQKWKAITKSAPTLKCPDCKRGPLLARQNWCLIRGIGDRGGPPRATCKGCIKTKWRREGKRFVRRERQEQQEKGEKMLKPITRYQVNRREFSMIREETGLSQEALAQLAGCTRGLIRRIEDVGPVVEVGIETLTQLKIALEGNGANVEEIAEVIAKHHGDYPEDPD